MWDDAGEREELGERLRQLPTPRQMSQVLLADTAGMSTGFVGSPETGKRGAPPERLRRMSSAVGLAASRRTTATFATYGVRLVVAAAGAAATRGTTQL